MDKSDSIGVCEIRRMAWEHPEWWMLALSLCAWAVLLSPIEGPRFAAHAGHNHAMAASANWGDGIGSGKSWIEELSHWSIMVAAMMFPAIIGPVRITAGRSLWRRRHWAIAGFLLGYVIPWMVVGLAWFGLLFLIRLAYPALAVSAPIAAGCVVAIVVIWQLSAVKRRALVACHSTRPLAPRGWAANRDCARYGLVIGRACVVSCWPLMLVPMLASHIILMMAAATAVVIGERYWLLEAQAWSAVWAWFGVRRIEAVS